MDDRDKNGNENGVRIWQIIKDIIQFAIVPLLYLGYTQIDHTIKSNASVLREVQITQVRVIETVRGIQTDLREHEARSEADTTARGRVHHTGYRSCIECKNREGYPMSLKNKPLLYLDKPSVDVK